MSQQTLLLYVFGTFVVGVACFGIVLQQARRRNDGVARAFLVLYAAFTLLVTGTLLLAYVGTRGDVGEVARFAVRYLESFIGQYGVMFALPYFAHRVFAVDDPRREKVLAALVIAAFIGQHLTEFVIGGVWDDRGDIAEDVIAGAIVVYTLLTAIRRRHATGVDRRIAGPFIVLFLIGLPGVMYDIFIAGDAQWRSYPFWYCLSSVWITVALVRRAPATTNGAIPVDWGLSPREKEVAERIRQGMSNKAIARDLAISPNTVKTHLRSIYDKTGVRTRLSLLTLLTRSTSHTTTRYGGSPERMTPDHPAG